VREGGLYLWVVQNRRQDFVVDEAGKAIGQSVVLKTSLALLAIIAAVFLLPY
jgi:hypothetical protein